MDSLRYDIQELVKASGVPRRTIHFYVQQGILPPPEGAGLGARYSEEHLNRLRLSPVLREQGLRLDDIRARFAAMDPEAVKAALGNAAPAKPQPQAAAYRIKGPDRLPRIHEVTGRPAELPGIPVQPAEARYIHYALPAGMRLVVPDGLNPADRQRVQMLVQAAQQIFSGGGFYAQSETAPEPPDTQEG